MLAFLHPFVGTLVMNICNCTVFEFDTLASAFDLVTDSKVNVLQLEF